MKAPQVIPTIFRPLIEHIHRIRLRQCTDPTAWIITDNTLVQFNSQQPNRRIEDCEFWLSQQESLGCLRYAVSVRTNLGIQDHTLIQLYDGTHFSHTLFQPHAPSQKESWWIEPWQLDHLLN